MLELFRSPRRTLIWCVEATLIVLLATCVAGIRVGWARALGYEHMLGTICVSLVAQTSLYYHGLYGREAFRTASPHGARPMPAMLRALTIAAVIVALLRLLLPRAGFGTGVALAALGAAALVLPMWRAAFQRVSSIEAFRHAALVLGTGPLARACAEQLRTGETGLSLAGVLAKGDERADGFESDLIGTIDEVGRIARDKRVRTIVVACSDRRGAFPAQDLLELKFLGIDVVDGNAFYERAAAKLFVSEIRPSHFIFADGFPLRRTSRLVKRAFDVVSATAGLLLALPIMALTALAIRLDSAGPVFYAQVRAGLYGQPFLIRKFRSMRTDAEATTGAAWATENDPRVTRVGRFIRRTRIDELPQLWNVLVGEMSMVGPRPERPVFCEQLERQIPFFRQRLFVKPGLTGHAQVRARYAASTEDHLEKLSYDLYYIKSQSLWFDLSILFDTFKVVLLRIGAR